MAEARPKKQPQRMCVSCRTRRDKRDLIRVTLKDDGTLVYDPTGKLPGRGAYLCKDSSCIKLELKAHRIARGLNANTSGEDLIKLSEEILKLCEMK
ncbi:MAG: YlxR family protein [Clostridiales bacterium]|nr:YlxR family protein [Clostridiales bacterium]